MDLKNISSQEFLKLPKEKQDKILNTLKECNHKYNELSYKQIIEENKKKKDKIKYNFNIYDGFVDNTSNRIDFYDAEQTVYEIFLCEEELNDMEAYGLRSIMIERCEKQYNYDFTINLSEGKIANDIILIDRGRICNISKKCTNDYILNKINNYKYAYVLCYHNENRNEKSWLWRLFHKRKFNIDYKIFSCD